MKRDLHRLCLQHLGRKIHLFNSMDTSSIAHIMVNLHELIFPFAVGKIIKDVESEKNKLISNRDLVQKRVEATDRTEKVNDAVFDWLKEMEKLIEEDENLKIKIEPLKILNCYCLPLREWWADNKTRYRMYEEMLKKTKALNTKCEFEPFSGPIPGLEHFSSGNFLCFESTKVASDQLLEALQDDSTRIIGLYGKRGSGKTTLVKVVGKKAQYLRIFDAVLFVTVSQNTNVRRIQDEIADLLNLEFDKNTKVGRARKIYSTLESMDRILVILDDVQTMLDPEDIGVPCNSNGCKVLLTTRRRRECALMDCQREIPLGPLSKDEAWTMLKIHSGIDDESSSDLLNVAQKVAFLCEWLPGTIKDVGSSLKSKLIKEWKASLDSLRHSIAQYQIFLSFKGEDTGGSFTSFLYHALCHGGFKTFMDEGGLHSGDQISPSLIKTIEASRLSIVVLSENYACSPRCLDELTKILECMEMSNQLVWPIFYKVEPTDIRHQKNSYGKAMVEHEKIFGNDHEKVQKWRSALFEVSNLAGKAYKTGYEYEFIQKIVEDANNIKNRLNIRSIGMD